MLCTSTIYILNILVIDRPFYKYNYITRILLTFILHMLKQFFRDFISKTSLHKCILPICYIGFVDQHFIIQLTWVKYDGTFPSQGIKLAYITCFCPNGSLFEAYDVHVWLARKWMIAIRNAETTGISLIARHTIIWVITYQILFIVT